MHLTFWETFLGLNRLQKRSMHVGSCWPAYLSFSPFFFSVIHQFTKSYGCSCWGTCQIVPSFCIPNVINLRLSSFFRYWNHHLKCPASTGLPLPQPILPTVAKGNLLPMNHVTPHSSHGIKSKFFRMSFKKFSGSQPCLHFQGLLTVFSLSRKYPTVL